MSFTKTEDFQALGRAQLEAMLDAGQWVLECHRILQKSSDNIVGEVLRGNGTFTQLDHYPPGDVFDQTSFSQYYYHAHREGEHGHFHTFVRSERAAKFQPIKQSQMDYMDERDDTICHVIAISMDNAGLPIGLFTTNRWVTAENWFSDADTATMLPHFEMDLAPPSWPVNIWISGMLRLFRPQIEDLILKRDQVISAWAKKHPDTDVFEDRGIDILSEIPISIDHQINHLKKALAAL
ncbi:MAG: hypothetical protein JKY92_05085 [Magnetovibrio sp.]|nr:hypothetical protein [Magnetovibrio sp.]